ncbi:MAG: ABC transporter ATP-binding protein [Planctomycetaceae bacterium]
MSAFPASSTEPAPAAIVTERLGKAFGRTPAVLEGVSLSIREGEFVAIVGPSGCGKSTLLRLIGGLERPDAGTLRLRNADASRSGRTTFVFQEPALLPWRSVAGNIVLPLDLDGVPRAERAAKIAASLDLIGLSNDDATKFPRQLSGGMRMRVSLARALVTDPDLLLLDEPFAALDDILRHRLNEELHRLWCDQRWTAVFVTHNVAEAVFLAGRVLVMSRNPGRIAAEIAVPFPTPRETELRSEPEFAKLVGAVTRSLRDIADR